MGSVLADLSRVSLTAMFYTERQGNLQLLMTFKDVDFCGLVSKSSLSLFSRGMLMLRDVLAFKGELPKKCPILEGTKLSFDMVNFDPKDF